MLTLTIREIIFPENIYKKIIYIIKKSEAYYA